MIGNQAFDLVTKYREVISKFAVTGVSDQPKLIGIDGFAINAAGVVDDLIINRVRDLRVGVFLEQDLIDWLREQVKAQQQQRQAGNDYARRVAKGVKTRSRRRPLPELPELPG